MKVLLATDGSPSARAAVRMLGRLPLPAGSKIEVIHAIPYVWPAQVAGPYPAADYQAAIHQLEAQARAAAEHILEDAAAELRAVCETHARVLEGYPAETILRAAHEEETDLIVLGSRGLSGLQEFMRGSVSMTVAEHAACSVLVVHAKDVPSTGETPVPLPQGGSTGETPVPARAPLRVLVAVDGSPASGAAVRFLERFAWRGSEEVTVVRAVEHSLASRIAEILTYGAMRLDPKADETLDRLRAREREEAEQSVAEAAKRFEGRVAKCDRMVLTGHPAKDLTEVAERLASDIVVVGSRGLSGFAAMLMGSTSRRLLRHAPCSVLVGRELSA